RRFVEAGSILGGAPGRLRATRSAPGRGGNLRRHGLLGHGENSRDRTPHGPRGATRRSVEAGPGAKYARSIGRYRHRTRIFAPADSPDREPALSGEGRRSRHPGSRRAPAAGGSPDSGMAPRPSRVANGPDGGIALRMSDFKRFPSPRRVPVLPLRLSLALRPYGTGQLDTPDRSALVHRPFRPD